MNNQKNSWNSFISNGYGQKINCEKNRVLFRQGEMGDGFYYLEKGEVKISLLSIHGIERDIDYVLPGELLGEHGFDNNPYFTTALITAPSGVSIFMCK